MVYVQPSAVLGLDFARNPYTHDTFISNNCYQISTNAITKNNTETQNILILNEIYNTKDYNFERGYVCNILRHEQNATRLADVSQIFACFCFTRMFVSITISLKFVLQSVQLATQTLRQRQPLPHIMLIAWNNLDKLETVQPESLEKHGSGW